MNERKTALNKSGSENQRSPLRSRIQAAAYLDVSPRTFDRMQTEGQIPYVLVGQRKKYLQRDLDAYLYERRML